MDSQLPKGVRLALNTVADVLIDAVRPKIPRKTGAAAASLKASSSQTQARISAGGRKAPYYPFLDFGGRVGRKKATRRQYIPGGRYIYPTLAEKQDDIQAAMFKAVAMLAETNGIAVS